MSDFFKTFASKTMKSGLEAFSNLKENAPKAATTIRDLVKKKQETPVPGTDLKKSWEAGKTAAAALGRDISKEASGKWDSAKSAASDLGGKASEKFTEAFPKTAEAVSDAVNTTTKAASDGGAFAKSMWGMANETSKGFFEPMMVGAGIGAGLGGAAGGLSENGSFLGGMAGGASLGALGGAGYKAGMNKYKTSTFTNPKEHA